MDVAGSLSLDQKHIALNLGPAGFRYCSLHCNVGHLAVDEEQRIIRFGLLNVQRLSAAQPVVTFPYGISALAFADLGPLS
jgi:hypothetical protein